MLSVRPLSRITALALLCWGVTYAGRLEADFANLIHTAGPGTNAIVAIKAEKILESGLARRENWKENLRNAAKSLSMMLPPSASEFLLTAEIDFERKLPVARYGALNVRFPTTLQSVAESQGRVIETISGKPAFRTDSGAYVIEFDTTTFGIVTPANRQKAAAWCAQAASGGTPLPAYLSRATGFLDRDSAHIIMAIDLLEAAPEHVIRERLDNSEAAAKYRLDKAAAGKILASVQGATLALNFENQILGQLSVDFGQNPAPLKEAGKDLILEILGRYGAGLDELEQWQLGATDSSLFLRGELTPESMGLLMTVVRLPNASVDLSAGAADPSARAAAPQPTGSEMALASQAYYQSMVEDIDRLRLRRGAKTLGQKAMWIENTARHIDRLPILHVDEELQAVGAGVANDLRDISLDIKGIGIRAGAAEAQYYSDYYYDASADRRAVRAEERATGAMSAQELAQRIQTNLAEARRRMTAKYQVEF